MSDDQFLDQLLNLPAVVQAKLSPDGRWAAFVWVNVHENFDVFVVPCDGSQPPKVLTNTPEFTLLVNWLPDSSGVLVQEDHDGDEYHRFFKVSLDKPEEMIPLTEDRPPYFLRGGEVSPDGQSLYYGANYDFENSQPQSATWVYHHDLASGQRALLAKPLKPCYMLMDLNKAGTHLIYSRIDRHPAGYQYHLVGVDGQGDTEILNFGDQKKVFARWLPDSEHILFTSESTGSGPQEHISIGVLHVPSSAVRWLLDDPDRMIESLWVTPDGAVVVNEVRQARRVPSLLDWHQGTEQSFPTLPGNLIPLGRTPEGAWVGMYYSANWPAELVRFDLSAKTEADLASLTRVWERTTLQLEDLAPAESVTWPSTDGLEVQGWLYRAEKPCGRAVIFVHGGPTSHSESKVNTQVQYYVRRGFNVLDVNYRGSTGFGLAYRESIKQDGWGGREQDDITAAAQYLIENGLAEPGQVGVTGTSYGGYSSWCQITRAEPEIIGAAAPICGMTDLVVDYHTTRPDLRPYSEEMIGGSPDEVPEIYHERSPINFVQDIKGALLVIQGGRDPNVTPENVREVVKRLHLHDIPYQIQVFEDEGHGIIKTANRKRLYAQIADFFHGAFEG